MDKAQRDALREIAGKATPGPWDISTAEKHFSGKVGSTGLFIDDVTATICDLYVDGGTALYQFPNADANAAHIAACSPDKITALLDKCDELEAERDALREALNIIRHTWAGHSEECPSYHIPRGKCECDWPEIAAKCDAALSAKEDAQ